MTSSRLSETTWPLEPLTQRCPTSFLTAIEQLAILVLDNRRQLERVADHHHLHAAERKRNSPVEPQAGINCVEHVDPDHRDFVDNKPAHFPPKVWRAALDFLESAGIQEARRQEEEAQRQEEEALLDLYLSALGMLPS